MSKQSLIKDTDFGPFNFEFCSDQAVFIEQAINDTLFNQSSWISAELTDFANVFKNVSNIYVEHCSIKSNEEKLIATLKNVKFIAIVFYASEMQVVTDCLNMIGKTSEGLWRAKFLKAFHPEIGKTLPGEFAIFYGNSINTNG